MDIPHLTFYTTEGCHLCEAAYKEILIAQALVSLHLEAIDIQDEFEIYELYKDDIPIVFMNGEEIGRHRITAEAIIRKTTELKNNARIL